MLPTLLGSFTQSINDDNQRFNDTNGFSFLFSFPLLIIRQAPVASGVLLLLTAPHFRSNDQNPGTVGL
jgi:hypothetical protein